MNARENLLPPICNIPAEENVIGALLMDPGVIHEIADILTEESFRSTKFRIAYRVIRERIDAKLPVDVFLVDEEIAERFSDKVQFRPGELVDLVAHTPSSRNVRAYASLVVATHVRRRLEDAGMEIQLLARHAGSADEAVADAAKALIGIDMPAASPMVDAKELMRLTFADLADRYDVKGLGGMSTGLTDLDDTLGGLNDGDLVVVAARPSMGKTAAALVMAKAVARLQGGVVMFSMEMSRLQIGQRLVSMEAGVPVQLMRTPADLPESDWGRVSEATATISDHRIHVDDSRSLNIDQIRSRTLRQHARTPLRLVVIDYIQLMDLEDSDENRSTKIGEISRGLKKLAGELNCPVIALSQLNRKLEERMSKRPMMSDIRESGAIEQDADVIIFLYRDEYYHKASKDQGVCEFIIGKNRNGPTETVKVKSELQYARFVDLTAQDRLELKAPTEEKLSDVDRWTPASARRKGKAL